METKKKTGFIMAEEFVSILREFIREAKDEDTLLVGEVRHTLNRVVLKGEVSPDAMEGLALTRIEEYKENNPQTVGITSAHLWRDLMGAGLNCSLDSVDAALINLVEAEKIEVHSGQVTSYAPTRSGENGKKKT